MMALMLHANDPCWCGSGRKLKRCHRTVPRTHPPARPVTPGRLSAPRPLPPEIARPDYADTGEPGPPRSLTAADLVDADRIRRMRIACRAAAEVLSEVGAAVAPGGTTDHLDALAHQAYIDR